MPLRLASLCQNVVVFELQLSFLSWPHSSTMALCTLFLFSATFIFHCFAGNWLTIHVQTTVLLLLVVIES